MKPRRIRETQCPDCGNIQQKQRKAPGSEGDIQVCNRCCFVFDGESTPSWLVDREDDAS